jgi:hypothetical protein
MTRPCARCACLWSLRPLRRLRWAPPSLWLCLGALLLFRGCLALCIVVIVGFFFSFTLLCCRPILSLSSFSPCLRSAPRVLPWFGTVGHRFSALIVCRIRFIFFVFAFFFNSRLGSLKLAAVAYRFFPRLAHRIWSWRVRFYCGSLPSVPFSPLSSSSGQGGVALICLSCVFLVTVLGGKADCGRCSLDFLCVSRRGK